MGSTDEQFCLRWNDFQTCIKSTFQGLREEKEFMDVTISCDGEQVTAHKVILSACSVTFRQILMKNPAPHPVILLWDVSARDLTSILDFMYHGEVNVKQENLNSFLAVAEKLRVRGLSQGDTNEATNSAKTTKIPSSQPEKSKARVSDISFSEPSLKRPRPSHESQDDDIIEEIPPSIVKQEVGDQSQATPGSSSRQVRPAPTQHDYQLTDPGQYDETADYAEEYGYEDEMGYAEGVLDPNQAKDLNLDYRSVSCPVCWKEFKDAGTLKIHIRDIHTDNEQKFTCNICDKQYKSINTLRNHRSLYHKGEK